MKHSIYSKVGVGICAAFLITATSGCMEDAYNPNANKNELPPIDKVFGYETRGDVKLTIDYNAPGFQANFQIFDEDPIAVPGTVTLKEGVKPIYSANTTTDGKFEGAMNIPTAVKEVWLYTDRWGLSSCKKLAVTANGVTYDANDAKAVAAKTRSYSSSEDIAKWFKGNGPYDLTSFGLRYSINSERIYAGVKWTTNGDIKSVNLASDVFTISETANGQKIADISKRAQNYLGTLPMGAKRAELLIKDPKVANITTKETSKLNMTFLDERGQYANSLGYYYYKTGNAIEKTSPSYFVEDFNKIKKYVVFPHAAINEGPLTCGSSVALKFYGDNGDQPGTYEFPKGYVIGFFLVPDGFVKAADATMPQYALIDGIRPNNPQSNQWGFMHSSNELKTSNTDFRRFISLYDEKSKSMVLGIEDELGDRIPDGDYCDVTFIVTSDKDINGGQPIIPDVPEEDKTDTQSGTLVFEDTWPNGGDYDLNDVAVKYKRTITYDKENYAKKLVEEFTFIQDEKAAENTNFFGYQFNKVNGGAVEIASDIKYEDATSSVLISTNSLDGRNKTYTVTRTFSNQITKVNKDVVLKDFNPYIIVTKKGTSFEEGTKQNRTEVHLPKHPATTLANTDQTNTKDDIYYVNKTNLLPFAINIATDQYILCTEKKKITEVYPRFANWANTSGKEDADWYTDKPNN